MSDPNINRDSPVRLRWTIHLWLLAPLAFGAVLIFLEATGFWDWSSAVFLSVTGRTLPDNRALGTLLFSYGSVVVWAYMIMDNYHRQTGFRQPRWITLGSAFLVGLPLTVFFAMVASFIVAIIYVLFLR